MLKKESVPPLVKVNSVAQLLSVSRASVHRLIESGDLEASEVNPSMKMQRRHRRVTRESLLAFYKKRFGHSLTRALAHPFEP